jgi:GNAT superfamily N-acetyltransferase
MTRAERAIRGTATGASDALVVEMIRVRYAERADIEFAGQDGYIPAETLARKIDASEVIIAESEHVCVGYARLEYLWSRIPYIALIRVSGEHQRRGVGRALLGFLEEALREAGHGVLLSSSQADEPEPQRWHRHMGFRECGRLRGINDGAVDEIFFRKELSGPSSAMASLPHG